jgi:hypothetical protein
MVYGRAIDRIKRERGKDNMSTFSDTALPEVPLEELVQLQLAVGLYVEVLKRDTNSSVQREVLPLVNRMYGELLQETEKRFNSLHHYSEDVTPKGK